MQIKNPNQPLLPSRNRCKEGSRQLWSRERLEQGQAWISHPFPGPARTELPLPEPGQQRFLDHSHHQQNPLCYSQSVFQVVCHKVDTSSLFVVPTPSQYSVSLYQARNTKHDLRTGSQGLGKEDGSVPNPAAPNTRSASDLPTKDTKATKSRSQTLPRPNAASACGYASAADNALHTKCKSDRSHGPVKQF